MKALTPVYTALSEAAAKDRFEEFAAEWGERYPAIIQLWRNSWAEFVPLTRLNELQQLCSAKLGLHPV